MLTYLIKIIFIITIIISPSLYLGERFNKKTEIFIPITLMSIILILYCGGMLNILKPTVYIISITSLVLLLLFIKKMLKNNKKIKDILTPGIVFFLLFCVCISVFHYGRLLSNWDEFSHWGDVVKAMVNINDFSTNSQSLSYFQSYLPAISLFQYFFQVIYGNFTESLLYIAYDIIVVSLFIPFTKEIKWKDFWKIMTMVIIILVLPVLFNNIYYSQIYVDSFLGFIFGYSLISIFLTKEYSWLDVINICIANSVLILTKDISIILFFINCLIMLFIYVYNHKKKGKNLKITQLIVAIILPLVFYLMWKINVTITGANVVFDKPVNIADILNTILRQDSTYRTTVLLNFIDALSNKPIITNLLSLNFYTLLAISLGLFYGISTSTEKNKSQKNTILSIIIIGCIIYTIAHFALYITKFTEYEALKLASYERYIGIYFIAIFMFVGCYILSNFDKCKNLSLIFVVILISLGSINNIFNSFYQLGDTIYLRSQYNLSNEKITEELKQEKKRIYFISEDDTGIDYWTLKFVNRNNLSSINKAGTFSIGLAPYNEKDIYTIIVNPSEWQEDLKNNFDYVYLYDIDEVFINTYASLFYNIKDIQDNTLFKVDENGRLFKVR